MPIPEPRLFLLALLSLIVSLGSGAVTRAHAADCGDGVAPCGCDDTVVVDTTLDATDPVTSTICPCNGLTVQGGGVTLDLGGRTLTGSGQCVGIEVSAFGVTVVNGHIHNFGTGLEAFDHDGRFASLELANNDTGARVRSAGNVLAKSIVHQNRRLGIAVDRGGSVRNVLVTGNGGAGILVGDSGKVERSTVTHNAEAGVLVTGVGGTIANSSVRDNGAEGIVVAVTGNTVARNVVTQNLGTGIDVSGGGHAIDQNRVTANGGHGINFVAGGGNTVTRNITSLNGGDDKQFHGMLVGAVESEFSGNRSERNAGFGIAATAAGNGYDNNICSGNGLGDSDPSSLCR
jgi:hypothetical protein